MEMCLLAESLSFSCGCDLVSSTNLVSFLSPPSQLTLPSSQPSYPPYPPTLPSCPYISTWKLSTLATWQKPRRPPLRMVCLWSGNFQIDAAGSLDAPTFLQGSTCTSCTGCSGQQDTETLNIGRSWCGEGWMQIRREQRRGRRRKRRRARTRQGWPKPWWGSESEQGIKQVSERRDSETTSGSGHQDISGQ